MIFALSIIAILFCIGVVGYGILQRRWFIPLPKDSLRVLMYHDVRPDICDGLTITPEQLHAHIEWLQHNNYTIISAHSVVEHIRSRCTLPHNAVLLTFDDAYETFLHHAVPVLTKLRVPAIVFVPTAFIGMTNYWDDNTKLLMSEKQLRELVKYDIAIGSHSHAHLNYAEFGLEEVWKDSGDSYSVLTTFGNNFVPLFAYPYGKFPKEPEMLVATNNVFRTHNFMGALRIKNRINPLPLENPFLITRTDITGYDTIETFARKVRTGGLQLF